MDVQKKAGGVSLAGKPCGCGMPRTRLAWRSGTAGPCHHVTASRFPSKERRQGDQQLPVLGGRWRLRRLGGFAAAAPSALAAAGRPNARAPYFSSSFEMHLLKIAGEWLEKVSMTY